TCGNPTSLRAYPTLDETRARSRSGTWRLRSVRGPEPTPPTGQRRLRRRAQSQSPRPAAARGLAGGEVRQRPGHPTADPWRAVALRGGVNDSLGWIATGRAAMSWTEITSLVELARTGDRAAYGELVERFRTTVYGIALARLRNPAEAEELTQEVFLHG